MFKSKTSVVSLLLLLAFFSFSYSAVQARGGFGGGFRGGGFRGMGGYRGYRGYRGFPGGRAASPPSGWGTGRHTDYHSKKSNVNNTRPMVSDAQRLSSADRSYAWSNRMPTDMGPARSAVHTAPQVTPHRTRAVSPANLRSHGQSVRAAFHHRDVFRRDFWGRYRRAWWYGGWWDYWAWYYYYYDYYCQYWDGADCNKNLREYSYGTNIKFVGNDVYYGNKKADTAQNYFTEAQTLATSVAPSSKVKPNDKDWMPMGVFTLTQGDQTDSQSIFHLASNKKGELRGNFYNPLTADLKPLQGKIDMKTQRAAWTVGDNNKVVYDTGLKNILSDQSTLLIHYDGNQTQQWDLVRMKKVEKKSK